MKRAIIGAIVAKDLRILWPYAVALALTQFILRGVFAHPLSDFFSSGGVLLENGMGILKGIWQVAAAVFIAMLAHTDAAIGPRRDWKARPVDPANLLVAKLAAIFLALAAPQILGDAFYNLTKGLPIGSALGAAVGPAAGLMYMGLAVLVLAWLCTSVIQAILFGLLAFIIFIILNMWAASMMTSLNAYLSWAGWPLHVAEILVFLILGGVTLWLLLVRREAARARAVFLGFLAVVTMSYFVPRHWVTPVTHSLAANQDAEKLLAIEHAAPCTSPADSSWGPLGIAPLAIGGEAGGDLTATVTDITVNGVAPEQKLMIDLVTPYIDYGGGKRELLSIGLDNWPVEHDGNAVTIRQGYLQAGWEVDELRGLIRGAIERTGKAPDLVLDYDFTLARRTLDQVIPGDKGRVDLPGLFSCATQQVMQNRTSYRSSAGVRSKIRTPSVLVNCGGLIEPPVLEIRQIDPPPVVQWSCGMACPRNYGPAVYRLFNAIETRSQIFQPMSGPFPAAAAAAKIGVRAYEPVSHFSRQIRIPGDKLLAPPACKNLPEWLLPADLSGAQPALLSPSVSSDTSSAQGGTANEKPNQ